MPIPVTITLSSDTQRLLLLCADRIAHSITEGFKAMSDTTDRLAAEVAGIKGAAESAVVLLDGLAAYIKANAEDPVALNAFADDLAASRNSLADAVARDPVPAPVPPPAA